MRVTRACHLKIWIHMNQGTYTVPIEMEIDNEI